MTKLVIGIDNGHGLSTPGKRTPKFTDGTKSTYTKKDFMHEWEFNHRTAQYLKAELERCGFGVVMLSDTEEDTSIGTRVRRANNAKVHAVVSIHANALNGLWGAQNGIETLTWKTGESPRIGKIVQEELVNATRLRNRGLKDGSWTGIIRDTNAPAILVECGFMDNLTEAKLLLTDAYRRICAGAIAKGLCRSFGKPYIGEKPPAPQKQVVKEGPKLAKNPGAFTDIEKTDEFNKVAQFLKDEGIFKGKPDGRFGVDEPITRRQVGLVIHRLMERFEGKGGK